MRIKNAIERLKRQIKRKRGWLLAGVIPFAVIAALIYLVAHEDEKNGAPAPQSEAAVAALEESSEMELILHKLFICGEQLESLGYHSDKDIEAMKAEHPDWILEGIDGERVIYSVVIEDLSPDCRRNAYFGLDPNNSLTLYEGKPENGKIVRTYFQVDVEHLENSLPQETVMELREGIKVTDFAEFNSVLSTFSDYALDEAEQVVKPAP